jgi:hypothetical protein
MRRDRFLIFILIGISLLAITAVVSVLVRTQHLDYTDDSSPAGIVQNYVLALQRDDLEMAYSYLADLDHKPSLLEFQSLISTTHGRSQTAGIRIGETHVIGDDATLELVVLNLRSGSFLIDELSQRDDVAVLVRQDSQWRISQMPFEFWMHNWYREARGPVPLSPPN